MRSLNYQISSDLMFAYEKLVEGLKDAYLNLSAEPANVLFTAAFHAKIILLQDFAHFLCLLCLLSLCASLKP